MALDIGARLGPYEIIGTLGAGGMGEVYRARDSKLKRDVALKVLPSDVAADPERLARFQREAEVLASLNHPNIAHVHGLEDIAAEGAPDGASGAALVMELVEGEDLSERLARGAMPVDEVSAIAKQIAEALESAHDRGIVHRDLKPANIKVRPDGTVKVLDFGLAKAMEAGSGGRPATSLANSPTITSPAMTLHGVILGTAAYMAPEQARGAAVDRRADIWAFGCVCFEMLTGRKTFDGETVSDTIASVLQRAPDLALLPSDTPAHLRYLLSRCLEKDARRRLRDIGEARLLLAGDGLPSPAAAPTQPRHSPLVGAVVALVAVAAGAAGWFLRPPPAAPQPAPSLDVNLALGGALYLDPFEMRPPIAISDDGSQLVYALLTPTRWHLVHRRLDAPGERVLPNTSGALYPFFSPDGAHVAFFQSGKLKRMPLAGGPAMELADAPDPWGAAWSDTGVIVYTPYGASALWQVPAAGGTAAPLTTLDATAGDSEHSFPDALPNGRIIYFAFKGANYENGELRVVSIASGETKVVFRDLGTPRFVPPSHLMTVREGRVLALPFDAERAEVIGEPQPLVDDIFTTALFRLPILAISRSGTLASAPGGLQASTSQLVWMDRSGRVTSIGDPSDYHTPAVTPDGRHIAYIQFTSDTNVWQLDVERGVRTPITANGAFNVNPTWHPDGRSLLVSSTVDGTADLYVRQANDPGLTRLMPRGSFPRWYGSWSPNGALVAYEELKPATRNDIHIYDVAARTSRPFRATPNAEAVPKFSPDGRWLSFAATDTGRYEIYVAPIDNPAAAVVVSTNGGRDAQWSPDSRSIFFLDNRGGLFEARLRSSEDRLVPQRPQLLFAAPDIALMGVTTDGRFFGMRRPETPRLDSLRLVTNLLRRAR